MKIEALEIDETIDFEDLRREMMREGDINNYKNKMMSNFQQVHSENKMMSNFQQVHSENKLNRNVEGIDINRNINRDEEIDHQRNIIESNTELPDNNKINAEYSEMGSKSIINEKHGEFHSKYEELDYSRNLQRKYEELGGKRRMTINFCKDEFYSHEIKYLSQNRSPFLKMNFIHQGETVCAYYDVTNYIGFKQYMEMIYQKECNSRWDSNARFKKEGAILCEIIRIFLDSLKVIKVAEDLLLFSDSFSLSLENIYVNTENRGVRLAYISEKKSHNKNQLNHNVMDLRKDKLNHQLYHQFNNSFPENKLIKLVEGFEQLGNFYGVGIATLTKLKNRIIINNPGINGIINEVILLHRDSAISYGL